MKLIPKALTDQIAVMAIDKVPEIGATKAAQWIVKMAEACRLKDWLTLRNEGIDLSSVVAEKQEEVTVSDSSKTKKLEAIGFEKKGKKIILPEGMSYETALAALELKRKEDETFVGIHEEVEAFPLDGAYALMNVLKERYGWASPVPRKGFFGDQPPVMVNLEIGFGENTQVIWGDFEMPGIDGKLTTGATAKGNRHIFVMSGKVRRKHENDVKEIAQEVRAWVHKHSVYKGKAIRIHTDEDGDLMPTTPPTFLDLSRVRPEELILPDPIMEQVETSLFTPIEHTAVCRKNRIPLKRSLLLEGPFGTGKTLTAYVAALKCAQNGWTFIYLDRVGGLDDALAFARMYSPSVIFAEDIDRVIGGQERTVEIDDVLNTIDGIESKNTEVMVILTTNNVETINKAMLRPGRLDAIISILPPDAAAAEKLMRLYGRDLIAVNEDLEQASFALDGCIPAVIREAVERAKLAAIRRSNGQGSLELTGADLAIAARSLKHHLELMSPDRDIEATPEQALGEAFGTLVEETLVRKNSRSPVIERLSVIEDKVVEIRGRL